MTPTRFRECLDLLRWSQRGLADALGRNERTVRRMATGDMSVPADLAAWLERHAQAMETDPLPVLSDGRRRQEEAA